jgi:hypothetical protein
MPSSKGPLVSLSPGKRLHLATLLSNRPNDEIKDKLGINETRMRYILAGRARPYEKELDGLATLLSYNSVNDMFRDAPKRLRSY